ncbi:hypothetical protein ACOMHN_022419 [Nucella lapillus]
MMFSGSSLWNRNVIRNGVWPTSLWNLSVCVLALTVVQVYTWPLTAWLVATLTWIAACLPLPQGTPHLVKVVVTSFVAGLVFFIILLYVRRYLLRALLSYRGWMYEPPRKQSALTLLWGALVRVLTGSHPTLYSYQRSLPRLSVPPLRGTMDKLMASLRPLYQDRGEEYNQLQQEALQFERTVGPKLQKALLIKSWLAPNYVSDWWEKYVYLMGRSPLPINSNYYIMDQCNWSPTYSQSARAATMMHELLTCKQMIERQSFEPLVIRNTIPICMEQYERIFSTTRVPGEEMDTLVHYDMLETKHLVVYCKGVMYVLEVYDSHRRLLSPQSLQKQFQWIINDADNHQGEYSAAQRSIPALTTLDRSAWWRIRRDHFSAGINRDSLRAIESAILFVNLDSHSFDFKDLSGRASYLLHGDGTCVWFDKSCCVFIFRDGKMGMNCEHSFADAPVVAHTIEYNMVHEKTIPGEHPLLPPSRNPTRLVWEVDSTLEKHISHALTLHQQNIDDLDLQVHDHGNFGKGFMKTCKVSPDAFIQMALQATYLKNAGKLALTYEAAMTRLYLQGRTETVRSLTSKAAAFARAFVDKSVSNAEKRRLLTEACHHHQVMYKDAMNGKAIDRHLFALYVVSRGMGYAAGRQTVKLVRTKELSGSRQTDSETGEDEGTVRQQADSETGEDEGTVRQQADSETGEDEGTVRQQADSETGEDEGTVRQADSETGEDEGTVRQADSETGEDEGTVRQQADSETGEDEGTVRQQADSETGEDEGTVRQQSDSETGEDEGTVRQAGRQNCQAGRQTVKLVRKKELSGRQTVKLVRTKELSGSRQTVKLVRTKELSGSRQTVKLVRTKELSGSRQTVKLVRTKELSGSRQTVKLVRTKELSGSRQTDSETGEDEGTVRQQADSETGEEEGTVRQTDSETGEDEGTVRQQADSETGEDEGTVRQQADSETGEDEGTVRQQADSETGEDEGTVRQQADSETGRQTELSGSRQTVKLVRTKELSGSRQTVKLVRKKELSGRQTVKLVRTKELSGSRQTVKLVRTKELSGSRQTVKLVRKKELSGRQTVKLVRTKELSGSRQTVKLVRTKELSGSRQTVKLVRKKELSGRQTVKLVRTKELSGSRQTVKLVRTKELSGSRQTVKLVRKKELSGRQTVKLDCEFLKKVLSIPWTLSTSQQPQQQIASAPSCNEPQYYEMLSPGGGFGPVSDDGYGVSYMIPGDRRIFFHVSSKRSHPGTDSKRFVSQLFETMQELKDVFEEEGKEGQ